MSSILVGGVSGLDLNQALLSWDVDVSGITVLINLSLRMSLCEFREGDFLLPRSKKTNLVRAASC